MHAAFLLGISHYPDHTLKGVSNDLTLLTHALQHHNYPPSAIHVFDDSHTTRSALHMLFSEIYARYKDVEQGSCYLHISASGACSTELVAGGVLPSDGDVLDFNTAFSFAELNQYLPVHPGIRVVVTLDTWHANLAVDSLSPDVTLLTIGGEEKMVCRAGEVLISLPDGTIHPHGRFSWTFAQALLHTPARSSWISILSEMERLTHAQCWEQPLLFHGQPTQLFGLFDS